MLNLSASTGLLLGAAVLCGVTAFVFFRFSRLKPSRCRPVWAVAWALLAHGVLIEAGHRFFGFGMARWLGAPFLIAGLGYLGIAVWEERTGNAADRRWLVGVLFTALLSVVGAILPPMTGQVVFGSVLMVTLAWLALRVSDWDTGEIRPLFFSGLAFLAAAWATIFIGGLFFAFSRSDAPTVFLGLVGIGLLAAASFLAVAGGKVGDLRTSEAGSEERRDDFPGSEEIDPLTGCANRLALRSWFDRWRGGEVVSLVLVDVNNLNGINQHHGRAAGDEALQLVAGVLKNSIRPGDLVVRWGGGGFVAVLRGAGPEAAKRRFTSLISILDKTTEKFLYEQPLRVDWGVASCNVRSGISNALAEADESMYAMKRRRRGLGRGGINRAPSPSLKENA